MMPNGGPKANRADANLLDEKWTHAKTARLSDVRRVGFLQLTPGNLFQAALPERSPPPNRNHAHRLPSKRYIERSLGRSTCWTLEGCSRRNTERIRRATCRAQCGIRFDTGIRQPHTESSISGTPRTDEYGSSSVVPCTNTCFRGRLAQYREEPLSNGDRMSGQWATIGATNTLARVTHKPREM